MGESLNSAVMRRANEFRPNSKMRSFCPRQTERQLCPAATRNARDVDVFQSELKGSGPELGAPGGQSDGWTLGVGAPSDCRAVLLTIAVVLTTSGWRTLTFDPLCDVVDCIEIGQFHK